MAMNCNSKRILRLSGSQRVDTTLSRIYMAIQSPLVDRLVLWNINVVHFIEPLSQLIASKRHWKEIGLLDCYGTEEFLEQLFSKPLSLNNDHNDHRDDDKHENFIDTVAVSSSLEQLSERCMASIAQGVATGLRKLSINAFLNAKAMELLSQGFAGNGKELQTNTCCLEELDLSKSTIQLHSKNPTTDHAMDVFCNELSQCKTLKSLCLQRCNFKDYRLAQLLSAIGGMPSSSSPLLSSSCPPQSSSSVESAFPNLEHLDLEGNACHELSWKALTSPDARPLPMLKNLEISNLCGVSRDNRPISMEWLSSLPDRYPSLEVLSISNYFIDKDTMEALFCSIPRQTECPPCLDPFTRPTMPSASTSSKLTTLALSECHLDDKAIQVLGDALPMLALKGLSLPHDDAQGSILRGLSKNTSLHHIQFEDFIFQRNHQLDWSKYEYWIDLNRGGRHALSKMDMLHSALWPLVLEKANHQATYQAGGWKEANINVLYHLLRNQVLLQQR